MNPVAGRTTHRKVYDKQALSHCLLGATNEQLAELFDTSVSTITRWIKGISTFRTAVKNGREVADAKVAASLYNRALGYSHTEDKIFCQNGEVTTVPTTKHYPPDATSAIFWLKNRQRAQWREKVDVEHSGSVTIAATALDEAI